MKNRVKAQVCFPLCEAVRVLLSQMEGVDADISNSASEKFRRLDMEDHIVHVPHWEDPKVAAEKAMTLQSRASILGETVFKFGADFGDEIHWFFGHAEDENELIESVLSVLS